MKNNYMITYNNHTLDKYLKPKNPSQKQPIKKQFLTIKVPPSSGLPSLITPLNPIMKYPIKPQLRQYQQQIVINCICNNTLVCLPTGLGKTHIAAIIIANYSRWFPQSKIIFLAPTRPLVRQQITALKTLRDQIPKQNIFEANGQIPAIKRQQLYQTHQIIFATPQTIENDLKSKRIDGRKIILIIFDECHRSIGNSSYSQIIKFMNTLDIGYRIIGLSATPGSQTSKIQQVIQNLNIKKIIYKDQKDPQVKKYLHQKTIHQIQIKQTNIIKQSLKYLDKFAYPSISLLIKYQLIQTWMIRNGLIGTSYFLLREKFNQKIKNINDSSIKYMAYAALNIVRFLLDCRKALTDQGYQTFKSKFFKQIQPTKINKQNSQEQQNSKQSKTSKLGKQSQSEQQNQDSLLNLYDYYPQESNQKSQISKNTPTSLPSNYKKGLLQSKQYKKLYDLFHQGANNQMHPKLLKLSQILKTFFLQKQGKAIIFTQLRLSAKQIKQYLSNIEYIKSQLFFGQSKTYGQNEQTGQSFSLQLKQKQQIQLINRYKSGQINTLISTSIGQQGLDIGQVDCIICYDGGHSPIRSIQRRGRTGRKRSGQVYILLMQGKECIEYKKGNKKQSKMKDILRKNMDSFKYYPFNSSLFEENTIIKVEYYQNIISIEDSNKKIKIKQINETQKPTKKKGKKKEKKQNGKKDEGIEEQSCQDVDVDVEISVTTINNLLQRYKQNEQIIEISEKENIKQQNTSSSNQISKSQIFLNNTPTNPTQNIPISSSNSSSQQPTISSQLSMPTQKFTEDQLTISNIDEQSSIIEGIVQEQTQSDEDDDDLVMQKYYNRKNEQIQSYNQNIKQVNQSDSGDSMGSEEIRSIIQNIHKKKELLKFNDDSW